ncbi:hypothetical protein E2C01_090294 [Portunus trituberculatus]|uniref:Uncharacterized protein n=1 Tax=Portunus trituberculatus TaxID=210409 RepID=A0A5B7JPQ5_PORTR|nr:hypothetical protein [Portunus trituberculatus]
MSGSPDVFRYWLPFPDEEDEEGEVCTWRARQITTPVTTTATPTTTPTTPDTRMPMGAPTPPFLGDSVG